MKRIIWSRPDGGVSVLIPVLDAIREGETEDEFINRAAERAVPRDAIDPRAVDESEIPADRTFRNAWERNGQAIGVNMPKARDLHREQLRVLREPKLKALDLEYMRADEAGDLVRKSTIAVEKQALRDVTADPAIEAATTPDELKAVMPAWGI